MKNGSKINQKSIKNGQTIDQKSPKIEVCKVLGQVWRRLGPSWAIQSVFGGILKPLGASWSLLEASWRPLGRSWAEKGGQHGSNLASKMEPRWKKQIHLKIDHFFHASWNRFLGGFLLIWIPKWNQVGTKMLSKIDINFEGRKPTKR